MERGGGLPGAKQRTGVHDAHRTGGQEETGAFRLLSAAFAQSEAGEPSIQNVLRIVNFRVAHNEYRGWNRSKDGVGFGRAQAVLRWRLG